MDPLIDEILEQLDQPRSLGLYVLHTGYCYLADVRLSAYRTNDRWGIVKETLICKYDWGPGHGSIVNVLCYFGNALTIDQGYDPNSVRQRTSDGPEGPTFDGEFTEEVSSEAKTIRIRNEVVPITTDPENYEAMGIKLIFPPKIQIHELLRWMAPRYRCLLLATDDEIQARFSEKLPMFMQLDEWRHPNITKEEKPSQLETFQMLAEAIATGDPSKYDPPEVPNTHWCHWLLEETI